MLLTWMSYAKFIVTLGFVATRLTIRLVLFKSFMLCIL